MRDSSILRAAGKTEVRPAHKIKTKDEPVFSPSYGEALSILGADSWQVSQFRPRIEDVKAVRRQRRDIQGERLFEMIDSADLNLHDVDEHTLDSLRNNYDEVYKATKSHVKTRIYLKKTSEARHNTMSVLKSAQMLDLSVACVQKVKSKRRSTVGCPMTLSDQAPESNDPIKQSVRNAYASGKLDLVNKNISCHAVIDALSDTLLMQLGNLVELRLARNQLEQLPKGMARYLGKLHILDISQNKLMELPGDISDISNLRELYIQYNKLETIDKSIFIGLKHLSVFLCCGNNLGILEEQCGNATNIKTLDISNNKLTKLPGSFSEMKSIESINLNGNRLETLALIKPLSAPISKFKIQSSDNWEEIVDPSTKEHGYINISTGECRRNIHEQAADDSDYASDNSDDMTQLFMECKCNDALDSLEDLRKKANSKSKTQHNKLELQKEWKELFDQESGQYYYCNSMSGETRWEPPMVVITPLKLEHLNQKTRNRDILIKRKRRFARKGKSEWTYWVNSESGLTEYGNFVSGKIFRNLPPCLDTWGYLTSLKTLLIASNNLTTLPEGIGSLKYLEKLDASHNKLVEIPNGITRLKYLKTMIVSDNSLEELPRDLGNLRKLIILNACGNHLTEIPDSIETCDSLERLLLNGNCLKVLNDRVGTIESLIDIKLLDNPDLILPSRSIVVKGTPSIMWDCRDRMKRRLRGGAPPAAMREGVGVGGEHCMVEGQFQGALKRAYDRADETGCLKLHFLGLRSIPEQTFRLNRLLELRISGHPELQEIPKHVARLPTLQVLHLAANGIKDMPQDEEFWSSLVNLKELDLSDNKVTRLPNSLSHLQSLKILSLSGNCIDDIQAECISGPITAVLEQLRLENNQLQHIPNEICNLKNLRVLFLTKNFLTVLPDRFGELENLEKFYISSNQLLTLPSSFGNLRSLKTIQMARNQLTVFSECLFSDYLVSTLESLNIQGNQLKELPFGFERFKKLKQLWFDMNPMHSPPADFKGKTWEASHVVEYCAERHRRFNLVSKLLAACIDFDFDSTKLFPVVNGAIIDKFGYLEDTKQVDALLDQFLNSRFYDYLESGDQIVAKVRKLFEDRKMSKFRKVLDGFLMLLETADRFGRIPGHCFEKNVPMDFGRNHEPVPCYAFKLDAIFQPIAPLLTKKKPVQTELAEDDSSDEADGDVESNDSESESDRESISSLEDSASETEITELENEFNYTENDIWPSVQESCVSIGNEDSYHFQYSKEVLLLALREYRGPYGCVSWIGAPHSFTGEAPIPSILPYNSITHRRSIEVKTNNNDSQFKRKVTSLKTVIRAKYKSFTGVPALMTEEEERQYHFNDVGDGRQVVMLPQLLVTFEEARRDDEEEALIQYQADIAVGLLEKHLNTPEGKEQLNRRVIDRMNKATDSVQDIKDELVDCRIACNKANLNFDDMNARFKAFQEDKPFDLHRFKSQVQAEKHLEKARRLKDDKKAELERLQINLDSAKARKKLKFQDMRVDTIRRLQEMVFLKERHKQNEVFRKAAKKNGLRRPFDGLNGVKFEFWKVHRQREKAAAGKVESSDEEMSSRRKRRKNPGDVVEAEPYDSEYDEMDDIYINDS